MQEDVENRTIGLAISGSRMSTNVVRAAIQKYLAYERDKKLLGKEKEGIKSLGRVSIKDLEKDFGETKKVDLKETRLRDFDRIARKYGVKYSVFKSSNNDYQIFYKTAKAENMEAAFKEYANKKIMKVDRPSVLNQLNKCKEIVKAATLDKTINKTKELTR